METRHPVEIYFGCEFPAICYHCKVLAAWSSQNGKIFWVIFVFFFGKTTLMIKFSKFCLETLHRDTDRRCCLQNSWKLSDGNRWNHALFMWPKKIGSLSNCRYCEDHSQSLPWPAPNIWLTTFQISSKSVHFWWSYSRPREGRQNAPQSQSSTRLSYSFSPSNNSNRPNYKL